MAPNGWDPTAMGGDQPGPGDGFNNKVDYGDIVRYNVVSQYQQMMANQTPMTYQQTRKYLTQDRFQYGNGDRDWRAYNRQAEMNRNAYGTSVASAMMNYGAFEATSTVATAVGMTGLGGFAFAAVAPIIPMHFVNQGMQKSLERQRYMNSMATDIESYRDRLGMPNISYGEATQLASNMTRSAYNRDNYFNPQQTSEIHKIALANDMLSAKTKGMSQGDIVQYEKNFKELVETVKSVTKVLNVTKEGGMSIIKEMQQQGFGTMGQIQSGILSAKAYGMMSGLGTQNMMNLGAAGAAAVQGTPWSSVAGSQMYQTGAAYAGGMAQGNNSGMQRSVAQAGGPAQAGAAIARFQMNVMQSGMGTKLLSYAMNANGTLDTERWGRLMNGGVSAYEITTGSAQRGYEMDVGGRAMLQRNKSKILSDMAEDNPEELMRGTQSLFDAWRMGKGGDRRAQAQVFASQFSGGDDRMANLYSDLLFNGPEYGRMAANRKIAGSMAGVANPRSMISRNLEYAYQNWGLGGLEVAGAQLAQGGSDATRMISSAAGYVGRFYKGVADRVFSGIVPGAQQYGLFGTARRGIGDMQTGLSNYYGTTSSITQIELDRYHNMSPQMMSAIQGAGPRSKSMFDIGKISNAIETSRGEEALHTLQSLQTAIGNGRELEWFTGSPDRLARVGIERYGANLDRTETDLFKKIRSNPKQAAADLINDYGTATTSINRQSEQALSNWDNYQKLNGINADRKEELKLARIEAQYFTDEQISNYKKKDANYGYMSNHERDLIVASKAQDGQRQLSKGLQDSKYFGNSDYSVVRAQAAGQTANLFVASGERKSVMSGASYKINGNNFFEKKWAQGNWGRVMGIDLSHETTDIAAKQLIEMIDSGNLTPKQQAFVTNFYGMENTTASLMAIRKKAFDAGTVTDKSGVKFTLQDQSDWKDIYGRARAGAQQARAANASVEDAAALQKFMLTDMTNPRDLNKNVLSALNITRGWTPDDIRKRMTDKTLGTDLNQSIKNVSQADLLTQINEGLLKAKNGMFGVVPWTKISIKDGTGEVDSKGNEIAHSINVQAAEEMAKQIIANKESPADKEKGLNTRINPPVLNYWNNQWVL